MLIQLDDDAEHDNGKKTFAVIVGVQVLLGTEAESLDAQKLPAIHERGTEHVAGEG